MGGGSAGIGGLGGCRGTFWGFVLLVCWLVVSLGDGLLVSGYLGGWGVWWVRWFGGGKGMVGGGLYRRLEAGCCLG